MLNRKREQMESDLCMLSLECLTVQISVSLKPHIIKQIDDSRGEQSRSSFIADCVVAYFEPRGEADKKDIARLESEVDYLRHEFSKVNDALAQRLLPDTTPKRSWWDRIRGR